MLNYASLSFLAADRLCALRRADCRAGGDSRPIRWPKRCPSCRPTTLILRRSIISRAIILSDLIARSGGKISSERVRDVSPVQPIITATLPRQHYLLAAGFLCVAPSKSWADLAGNFNRVERAYLRGLFSICAAIPCRTIMQGAAQVLGLFVPSDTPLQSYCRIAPSSGRLNHIGPRARPKLLPDLIVADSERADRRAPPRHWRPVSRPTELSSWAGHGGNAAVFDRSRRSPPVRSCDLPSLRLAAERWGHPVVPDIP